MELIENYRYDLENHVLRMHSLRNIFQILRSESKGGSCLGRHYKSWLENKTGHWTEDLNKNDNDGHDNLRVN
jgi:hypothetical protein